MEHSENFEKVKRYFERGLWGIARVRAAVTAVTPWITAAEYEEITGEKYEAEL